MSDMKLKEPPRFRIIERIPECCLTCKHCESEPGWECKNPRFEHHRQIGPLTTCDAIEPLSDEDARYRLRLWFAVDV